MLERTGAVACEEEKQRNANIGHEVHGKQYDELCDLLKGKRAVDGRLRRLPQASNRIVQRLFRHRAIGPHKIFEALANENSIVYVHLGLIYKEAFEEDCYNSSTFSQNQECSVYPRRTASVEYGQESDLWEQSPEEQIEEDERT